MIKHEDFISLDLDAVINRTLSFAQSQSRAVAAHWLSEYGLSRVHDCDDSNWQWNFAAADVVNQHLRSTVPVSEFFRSYQIWKAVDQAYPNTSGPKAPRLGPQMLKGGMAYPLYYLEQFLGFIWLESPAEANPVQLVAALKPGLERASRYVSFAYQLIHARNESFMDELTGLYNQKYLPLALDHEINRAKRENFPFTLMFLDIDYFKMVNDGRGHQVGSRLLVELGKVLKSQVRGCDYCFRYGGDEFIVLLSGADAQTSVTVAERIRRSVEEQTFSVEGHNLNLTVSIGLAAYPQHAQSASGLIHIADQAMYYGKRKSRNIVFVAS